VTTLFGASCAFLKKLLHHLQHRLAYKKRTEMVVEIVAQLEEEGQFPPAHYAFDNGVLTFTSNSRSLASSQSAWI